MIKKDARTGENLVGFTIIGDLPKGSRFCHCVRASRPERRVFRSRFVFQVTEAFTGRSIVQLDLLSHESNRFKQVQSAMIDTILILYRLLERQTNRRLAGKIVNLVRLGLKENLHNDTEVVEANEFEAAHRLTLES